MMGPRAPVGTEWPLLLAACSAAPTQEKTTQISELLRAPIHWTALQSLADYHGVQPLLTQALLSVEHQIPADALAPLKQSYQANLHKVLLLSREFVSIIERLSQAGVAFIPYKGLALAEMVYGDIALRQSGDIDLLIQATDLASVRKAVAELNYRPHQTLSADEEAAYLQSGYECAFDGPLGKNLLEVQWALQPRFYAVDLQLEGFFRRAVHATVAGIEVKALSPEDSFLVLALHAAKHVWGKLMWICDLDRIARMPALNWKQIGDQARELGIVRILRVTLQLVQRMLNAPLPALTQENLGEDRAAASLAGEIQGHLLSDRIFEVESGAYFNLMLRLRERRVDQMRFLGRLAFTPGPGEWAVTRLPKTLFPLYRVVRVTRLGARLISGRF